MAGIFAPWYCGCAECKEERVYEEHYEQGLMLEDQLAEHDALTERDFPIEEVSA